MTTRVPPLLFLILTACIALGLLTVKGCGGGEGAPSGGPAPAVTGIVTTTITDPAVCQAPNGIFQKVFVTITRVRAHTSSTAGPDDAGWIDLADLRKNPLQLDLLSLSQISTCVPTSLSSNVEIAAAQFQQIRLHLLSNTPASGEALPVQNGCSPGFNCVLLFNGVMQPLDIDSAVQSGIRISSGQLAGGNFTVVTTKRQTLNIDFDICSSLIQETSGRFRLKPLLHAGETAPGGNPISGRVVDTAGIPIPNAMIALEQPDPNSPSVDRIVAQRVTGVDGSFQFCGLPVQNFDVVVAAATPRSFRTSIILQVPAGSVMGNIAMVPETGTNTLPATITGQVRATNPNGNPASLDVSISALQKIENPNLFVTIPPAPGSTPNLSLDNGKVDFTMIVPANNPQFGNFGQPVKVPATASAIFWVNAQTFVPMNAATNPGSPTCTSPSLPTTFDSINQIIVQHDSLNTGQNISFTGCQ